MDINQMTFTLQKGFANAQQLAAKHHHQEVDIVHLWEALLRQPDNLLLNIYRRLQVDGNALFDLLTNELKKTPEVTGENMQGGQYVSSSLQRLLIDAEKEKERFKDDFLAVEHLTLAAPASYNIIFNGTWYN